MCVRGLVTDSPLEVVCESVAIPRKRIKHCVPMKSNQMCLSCENSSTVIIDQSNRKRHCMTSLSVSLLLRTVLPGEVSHVTRAFWGLHCLRWFVILRTLVPNLYCTVRINIVVGASLREHFLHHNQLLLHALLTTL